MRAVNWLLPVLLCAAAPAEDCAWFEVSGLRCLIGNNAVFGEHGPGYNGVFALSAPGIAESPFVPEYAGLNLEHYFDTRPRPENHDILFEPRRAPMSFTRLDDRTAELHQPPTPVFRVESWTRFTVREPYYIDMHFRCIPREPVLRDGLLGVFWASYINAPLDKSIHFLEGSSSLDRPVWVQQCTPLHNHESTVRASDDTHDFPFEEPGDMLYSSFSPLRYSVPFFYGRFRDRVLIFIFRPGPLVRFAHSPSGGGPTPEGSAANPAWDFQMLVPEAEVGRACELDMRLVYKPWDGRNDVLREVRGYLEADGRG